MVCLLAGAAAIAPARADGLAAAEKACEGAAPQADAESARADSYEAFERLRRNDAQRALTTACTALRTAGEARARARAGVRVLGALAAASRYAEAQSVADEVIAALGEPDAANFQPLAEARYLRGEVAVQQRNNAAGERDCAAAREELERRDATRSLLYAQVLVCQSAGLRLRRQLDAGDAALAQAASVLEAVGWGETRNAADVLNARAMLAYERQDLRATIRWTEAEVALTRRVAGPDDTDLLDPLATLGAVHAQLDEFDRAEAALTEGLRIMALKPEEQPGGQLGILQNLNALYRNRGQYAQALPQALRAVALAGKRFGEDSLYMIPQLNSLGSIYDGLGEYARANETLARALAIADARQESVSLLQRARLYTSQALNELRLGDIEATRRRLAELRAALGEQPGLDWYRGEAARLDCRLAAREAAWRDMERACADMGRYFAVALGEDNGLVLSALAERCAAQAQGALGGEACEQTRDRLDAYRRAHPHYRFQALAALAAQAEAAHDDEAALARRSEALALAESLAYPDPLWIAYQRMAELLHRSGETRLGIVFGKQAIAQIERLRRDFTGEKRRFDRGFIAEKAAVYRSVASWLMEQGRIDEALDVLRLLKAEELSDFVERAVALLGETPGVELAPAERALWDRYSAGLGADDRQGEEIERLSRLRDAKRITPGERERLDALLAAQANAEAARLAHIREFIASASRAAPAPAREPGDRAARLLDEVRRYGRDTAAAFLVLRESELATLVVTRAGHFERREPVDAAALRREIGGLLAAITRREEVSAGSRALYERLARPIDMAARRAGARRIVLSLDGALRYVPFAALYDGQRYLGEKYALQLHSPARNEPARPAPVAWQVRGLGVTQAVAGFPALPGVAQELCAIVRGPIDGLGAPAADCARQGALPGEGYADGAFTLARVRGLLDGPRGFSHLHVGSHFSLRPGNAMRSYLMLGDGQKLTLDAIARLDFSGIELVTLSACQTGLAGAVTDDGREVEGLTAIVQRRGARHVVASLWQVEDASTARLMQTLYRELAGGRVAPAEALRRAQRALAGSGGPQGRYRHPYYWAGFVVSGAGP